MLYIPGVVAAVCHGVLLLGGGILNQHAHRSMGFTLNNSMFARKDWNSFLAVIGHMFFPTFTVLCFGFSWLACAYESEVGAYCMVVAPALYAVLWGLWLCSGIGSGGSWSLWCCASSESENGQRPRDLGVKNMDPIDRKIFKNQEREWKKARRAIDGSIFGSDAAFYEVYGGSPHQRKQVTVHELQAAAHSPYLMERLQRESNEERDLEERRRQYAEATERQRRFNKAFEDYQSRLQAGVAEGPFIFEGMIVPIDDDDRALLEATLMRGTSAATRL